MADGHDLALVEVEVIDAEGIDAHSIKYDQVYN